MKKSRSRPRAMALESLEPRTLLTAFRSVDGFGNNLAHPDWGQAGGQLLRTTSVEYADGLSEPSGGWDGSGRPNPREISNRVVAQQGEMLNDRALTSFVFQWGQFLDHDLDLTEEAHPVEVFSVDVPAGDPILDSNVPIPLLRSRFDSSTGVVTPRQQINQITSYIDASNVYGSDPLRAAALRVGAAGLLRTSDGQANTLDGHLLPLNTMGLPNAAPPPLAPHQYFAAGDIRANEQPGLTSLHTLFVREHNRLAREIAARDFAQADLQNAAVDEQIYQRARQIVGAQIQVITYYEFLPALLGPAGIKSYSGYDANVNSSVANIFSAAIYRVGHTMLPNELLRLDQDGATLAEPLSLGSAFFDPSLIATQGIEPFLMGLGEQLIQEIDAHVVDGVRNLLFDPPAQFDLAAINIQRGRDHGLPDYNQARRDMGLEPVRRFAHITSDHPTYKALEQVYQGNINNVDVWLGGIAEDHIPGGSVGQLVHRVLADQFQRGRDGDRFYFENVFSGPQLDELKNTRLSDIIRRNTSLQSVRSELFRGREVFVFRAAESPSSLDITLRRQDRQLQIVDNQTQLVLASRLQSDLHSIVLFGTDQDDQISVDLHDRSWSIPIEVHGAAGRDELTVLGSAHGDRISILPTHAIVNGVTVYYGNFETVIADAGAGNDRMDIQGQLAAIAQLWGGAGHDWLFGSHGNEILVGGDGHDFLWGGDGDDLLIGGRGRDVLLGGGGNDLMVGDATVYDHHALALMSILAEWTSPRNLPERMQNISGRRPSADRLNESFFLFRGGLNSTIIHDGYHDMVFGGSGRDWRI